MSREFLDYVEDVINAIDSTIKFVEDMSYEDFSNDEKTIFAVIRALEIIGEATKKIPLSAKNRYNEIPWKDIVGMRNILTHQYFGVESTVIWKTINEDFPKVQPLFKKILADFDK